MYRSAKTRPQYLLRQLITSSLTAGSLLFMPLIGAAHAYIKDTDIAEPVTLDADHTNSISEGIMVSSLLTDDDLFTAPAGVDFAGSATAPNFINNGILTHVRDDFSEDSATFRILADNFSLTNATTGQITIGKNYPTTGTWNINGFVFSGTGGTLTNEGDIEGRGDLTVVLGGSNNTVTNSGTLCTSLTDGYSPTDSWFYKAIENKGSKNSLTNSGTIEAYYEPIYNSGSNFTLYNAAGGLINAASGNYAIIDYGDNTEVTNDGALSAINYTYRVVGGNANTLVNSGTISSTNSYPYRVTSGAGVPSENIRLRNENTGVIEAVNNYGVGFWDSTNITVTNAGTVKAGSEYAAYFSNDEGVSVTNSGNIEAGDDTVTILGGDNITFDNTFAGAITSAGTVAVTAIDVKNLLITNKGTINGNIEISIPRFAPKNYIPAVRLTGGTVDGDIIFTSNNNPVTSAIQKRDNAEVQALSDELKALKEQPVTLTNDSAGERAALDRKIHEVQSKLNQAREDQINEVSKPNLVLTNTDSQEVASLGNIGNLVLDGGIVTGDINMASGSIQSLSTPSGTSTNSITMNTGSQAYCISLQGSTAPLTVTDAQGKTVNIYPTQFMSGGTDNCHAMLVANSGLLDARYDKLSDKIINLDHKLQDGNTDWLFEVRYQDMRQDTDENQPHANSTILALSKLWHTTRGDWIFQASHDSTHIGQHLNNNSASIVLGHSQNWGKTSKLHMQLGGDRREMSLNLVGEQDTVTESSNYSVVYGEIGMGRVLHKIAGHDINMRMRLAAERIGSFGKGWDSDTISLMIPELSVSGRVLPSVLTDASHRLYGFLQKPMGDTTQKYTITGFSEDTFHYDTDVSGGIGYDLHAGVGANTMLHAKASYLNTGYLSLGLGISQNL